MKVGVDLYGPTALSEVNGNGMSHLDQVSDLTGGQDHDFGFGISVESVASPDRSIEFDVATLAFDFGDQDRAGHLLAAEDAGADAQADSFILQNLLDLFADERVASFG